MRASVRTGARGWRALSAVVVLVVSTASGGDGVLVTTEARRHLDVVLSAEAFGEELVVEPRRCPIADPFTLFPKLADLVEDDQVESVVRGGVPDALLVSIPPQHVSVATCAMTLDGSPISFVRVEVRPADESIESVVESTLDSNTVELTEGGEQRGGVPYHSCGARVGAPAAGVDVCV